MKRRTFSEMFLSYVAVLGVMIVLMAAGHIYNSHMLTQRILSMNRAALDTVRDKVDGKMRELFFLNNQLYANPEISALAQGGPTVTLSDRTKLLQAGRDLRTFQVSAGTDDLLLFFHQKDKVLHQGYLYSRQALYERMYAGGEADYGTWLGDFIPGTVPRSLLLEKVGGKEGAGDTYLYLTYPLLRTGQTMLALGFREETVRGWLAEVPVTEGGQLMVVQKDGRVIADSARLVPGGAPFADTRLFEAPAHEVQRTGMGGESYIASYVPSRGMDWYYVLQVPSGQFWSPSRNLLLFSLTLSVLCIGIILWLAYRFSMRHQSRLSAIIDKISALTPGGNAEADDDYALILRQIDALEAENRRGRFDRQSREIYGLLTGRTGEREYTESLAAAYPLGPRVAVYCASVADDSSFVRDRSDEGLETYILVKLFEELFEEHSLAVYSCAAEGAVWFCLSWGEGFLEALLSREQLMQRYVDYLDHHFQIRVRLLRSGVYEADGGHGEGLRALRRAYEDCLPLLSSSWTLPEKCVAAAGEAAARPDIYQYPAEYEQKLIHVIRAGDAAQARQIVGNVLSQMESLSADMATLLLFEVAATMAKAADTPAMQSLLESRSVPALLLQARSMDQKRERLDEILGELCGAAERAAPDQRAGYAAQVDAYIGRHYPDANLNVTAIAQAFHLSARYLSRVYREETGSQILARLHWARVEAARRLLLELPDDRIADIAARVGCADTGSFIRLFKRYTGVTPGDYRRVAAGTQGEPD